MSHPWAVFGHDTAKHLLQSTLGGPSNGPRHAYLFTGARHIGKTTLAQEFAKALLCTGDESAEASLESDGESHNRLSNRPCGLCRSCRLADSRNHPDLRVVQAVDKSGEVDRRNGILRVEQAGEIIREATLSPLESRYKCFIIQDIHTANASFANKLLKTLEEPPAHVVLLLTAVDRSSLLPTIVSRCQILELRPMDQATIAKSLEENWNIPDEKASLLARLSNGRMGWAIEQIDNEAVWTWRQEQMETLWQLIRSDRVYRLAYVEKVVKASQRDLMPLLELWTLWWRDIMLAQSGCIDACTNIDLKNEIEKFAQQIAPSAVHTYMKTLRQIEGYLRHTTNPRLALDVLLLQLPAIQ